VRRLGAAWERFWFEPEDTSTLALVRIAFGVVVLVWAITLTHDSYSFFTDSGVLPNSGYPGEARTSWGLLDLADNRLAVALVLAALSLAALWLIVGLFTRLAAVVVFVCLLSLERRNPFVFNSGDGLLKVIAFYMMLAPAGASLSLDRWRRARGAFWEPLLRAPWPMRLMQVQLTILYLATVWAKLSGKTWNDGTAVSYAVRLEDLARFDVPASVAHSELLANLLTYGTLAIEASVGVLVWNRALRPWVLGLGVLLHLGIDLTIRVGFFSYALFVLYVAFISPEAARRWIEALGRRAAAWSARFPAVIPRTWDEDTDQVAVSRESRTQASHEPLAPLE
jgi:Vitamin K-dependent gamma-carboxylase